MELIYLSMTGLVELVFMFDRVWVELIFECYDRVGGANIQIQ